MIFSWFKGASTSRAATEVTADDPLPITEASRLHVAADLNVPAAATNAVITYAAAGAGIRHVLGGVAWSYSAAPTGGRLTITDGGVTVFDLDIIAGGPNILNFQTPFRFAANSAVVITLASGAGAVAGKVNVIGHWTETI